MICEDTLNMLFAIIIILIPFGCVAGDPYNMLYLKNRVKNMFYHAYEGYINYAFPLDELRPLTCDGHDTWGSFSLTLVDALDTLAVMGNWTEFRRASRLLLNHLNVNSKVNVSVFETNIRVVGGLLSAHLLSRKAGFDIDPSWPCSGPLLRMAEAFARKLLPAFDTPTGMPYGTVNLAANAVPPRETTVTCVAGVGTFIVEFGALSRLTGDPRFEAVALRSLKALWKYRSHKNLLGNHIDIRTGRWIASDATIGAGVDSYFEYLVKGSALLHMPELDHLFREYKKAIDEHMLQGDWHFVVNKDSAGISTPVFQGLEAFWPSILSLTGDINGALRHLTAYHEVWKQYGFIPEGYNFMKREVLDKRTGYLLRPEFIESVYYVYRATKDPWLIRVATDVLTSIEQVTRTECGYATVMDVTNHTLENRMESFFLSETTKYLYLIFDETNFIHDMPSKNQPSSPEQYQLYSAELACYPESGGYIFNTEAHPIDPGSLGCCSIKQPNEMQRLPLQHGEPQSDPLHEQQTGGSTESMDTDSETRSLLSLLDVISAPFDLYFRETKGSVSTANSNKWCPSKSDMDQSILETWETLKKIVLEPSAYEGDESTTQSSSSKDDIFHTTDLETVHPPLLTCPYPAFHERFTMAGQFVANI